MPRTTPPASRAPENPRNSGVGESRRQVGYLHPEPEVGLVDAVAIHRLAPGDPAERNRAGRHPGSAFTTAAMVASIACWTPSSSQKAPSEVELGELELAIGPEVLVPIAAGDLEVALDPGDHQQLFEELRRLGQGVEVPWPKTTRDEEVAGALRRGTDQRRGLDLEEAESSRVLRIAAVAADRARRLAAMRGRRRSR